MVVVMVIAAVVVVVVVMICRCEQVEMQESWSVVPWY